MAYIDANIEKVLKKNNFFIELDNLLAFQYFCTCIYY